MKPIHWSYVLGVALTMFACGLLLPQVTLVGLLIGVVGVALQIAGLFIAGKWEIDRQRTRSKANHPAGKGL